MNESRKPRPLVAVILILLLVVGLAGAALMFLTTDHRGAATGSGTESAEATEALDFANRFVSLDEPDTFDQQMQLTSRSLRALYDQAVERDRQRSAPPHADAADLNPEHAQVEEKPAMAEASVWVFGLADAWKPGEMRLHAADATHAAIDVDLQVIDGPVVTDRLLLVREDGQWRVDDVLHGPDGRDGSLRKQLAAVP